MRHNMKKLIYSILSVVAVIILHASCMDEHDDPVIDYNEDANVTVTTTIKALKDKYADVVSANGLQLIEEDDTIFAVVVGNDESGNIYKQLFVQDETGGICISVDINNMNTDYCVGQRVAIYLKGLYIGGYGELAQIGVPYTDEGETEPQIGRMSKFVWEAHSERIGEARPEYLPEPTVITSAEQFTDDMLSTLVSLQGMHFDNPGIFTFADYEADDPATESRTMFFSDDTEVTVRTSRYGSGLAQMVIPGGVGTFSGILTTYRGEWQITARTADDILKKPNGEDNTFDFTQINTFIKEYFASDLGVFTSYSSKAHEDSIEWIIDYSSACAKGYVDGKKVDAVTYLVSEPVNLLGVPAAYVTFEHAINYADIDLISEQHQLLVSNDFNGDVDAAKWTVIPIYQASGTSFTFSSSGRAIVPDEYLSDGVVFALRHTSTTEEGSTWEVRNFAVVDGVGEEIKDMNDTDGAILYEDFSDGQGAFTTVNVSGDYEWNWDDRYNCMKMSGYGSGTNYANEDWLISPAINTMVTDNPMLTFRHAINFAINADNRRACCRVYVSTTYAGGEINESDWQQVEIEYPTSDSWSFIDSGVIDLPQSENLRIAFRYTCEDHDAPTWEVDNVMVK